MPNEMTELKQQVAVLASSQVKMENAMVSVADSLKALTRLEVQHAETRESVARAFTAIGKHDERLLAIDTALPTLKLSSNIFVRITTAVILFVAAAVVGSVIIK